jgi:predicted small secreted protein
MKDRLVAFLTLNGSTVGVVALIIVAVVMLTGCGTVSGFGKDVTGAAEWTRDKMSGAKTN